MLLQKRFDISDQVLRVLNRTGKESNWPKKTTKKRKKRKKEDALDEIRFSRTPKPLDDAKERKFRRQKLLQETKERIEDKENK
jgi:hypothetical protein